MSHSDTLENKLRTMKEERNYLECSIKCYSKRLLSSFTSLQLLNEKKNLFMKQNGASSMNKDEIFSSLDDTFPHINSEMLPKLIKLLEYEILRHILLNGIQRLKNKSIQIEERMRNMNTTLASHNKHDCVINDGQQPTISTGLECCFEKKTRSPQPGFDQSKFHNMEKNMFVDVLEKLKHHLNELDSELRTLREDAADWEQRLTIARIKVAATRQE